jgi:hypothetical protein
LTLGSTSSLESISISVLYLYLQHFVFGWILALAPPLALQFKLLAGGLIFMFLSFLLFLASKNHRLLMDRVFLLASLGAALTLRMVIWSLTLYFRRVQRAIFSIAVAVIVTWAGLWGYKTQIQSIGYSDLETSVLSGMVSHVPAWTPPHVILVLFDRTGTLANGDIFAIVGSLAFRDSVELKWGANVNSLYFQDAVRYIYNTDTVDAVLCFPETLTQRLQFEKCDLQADRVYSYEQVIAFEYTGQITLLPNLTLANGSPVTNYQPNRSIQASATPPSRYFTLFPKAVGQ